jgi:hypothetical protein
MEVYTQQAAAIYRGEHISVQPNMFNQILNYLSFREEILQGFEDGNSSQYFTRPIANHDVNKVIYDKNYLKFLKQKQKAQLQEERARQLHGEIENTTGYHEYQHDPNASAIRSPKAGNNFTMNKIQFVQYECIKSELRAEYDKRVNYLHKRIQR